MARAVNGTTSLPLNLAAMGLRRLYGIAIKPLQETAIPGEAGARCMRWHFNYFTAGRCQIHQGDAGTADLRGLGDPTCHTW
jgi:hypothetical protein